MIQPSTSNHKYVYHMFWNLPSRCTVQCFHLINNISATYDLRLFTCVRGGHAQATMANCIKQKNV